MDFQQRVPVVVETSQRLHHHTPNHFSLASCRAPTAIGFQGLMILVIRGSTVSAAWRDPGPFRSFEYVSLAEAAPQNPQVREVPKATWRNRLFDHLVGAGAKLEASQPTASREIGRMLAFAPFQGFIRGMSD